MRKLLAHAMVVLMSVGVVLAKPPETGKASWYGEEHRGRLMANGHRFNPDQLTAASWRYPLGTKVRVRAAGSTNSVEVVITDRGPGLDLVRQGRIIDLSRAAFDRLADAKLGLIAVTVEK
jgi:rare lipoprotein A